MKIYGTFAHLARFVYRIFKSYTIEGDIPSDTPSIFVVHHQNMSGPVHALLTLPIETHIWVYKVFFDRKECYNQYVNYTFTKRFGMPRLLAVCLAWIISLAVPFAIGSFAAIPVHRSSRDIVKTFKMSHDALISGESIIISPDIEYDDDSNAMGEIYTGFFHLEKNYFKATGKHLAFVPILYNTKKRTLFIEKPIMFDDSTPYNEQKTQVAIRIRDAINNISKK